MNCRTLDCPACGRPFSVYDGRPDSFHKRCPACYERRNDECIRLYNEAFERLQRERRTMFSDILDFFRRWWRQRRKYKDAGGEA